MPPLAFPRLASLGAARRVVAPSARRLASSKRPSNFDRADFSELRERSLLRHVVSSAQEGDPESVMQAMDVFWDTYFNGEGSAAWKLRGTALDQAVSSKEVASAMEIGSYCGYTAVRIARLMPEGSKLVSVEIDPLFAAIATKVVEFAGLSHKVTVEIGSLADRLPAIQRKGLVSPLNAVLLDHDTANYLPDLQLLERNSLVAQDTMVLCDWSLYPGSDSSDQAPTEGHEFMEYLKQRAGGTVKHSLRDKEIFTVTQWDFTI
ncbi:hypothetical protein AB1Y20_015536 [Prymnesium parvum]|uniref:catechol O-methyltransferase n=1 Tax=Prymnesium parvum TaxID=97485 RepID=A0AB34JX18_PRYPA